MSCDWTLQTPEEASRRSSSRTRLGGLQAGSTKFIHQTTKAAKYNMWQHEYRAEKPTIKRSRRFFMQRKQSRNDILARVPTRSDPQDGCTTKQIIGAKIGFAVVKDNDTLDK
ncbi:hypothetical protein CCR75_000831 [Bremia lactucae]|uniref:Uncharacterized protein n=1 Tax=Bremia lactucae TaxID=4779 RepID=A0A976IFY8_BRELC|nr:hypothetical protein CCR75_000831 [Bremia lactucae]